MAQPFMPKFHLRIIRWFFLPSIVAFMAYSLWAGVPPAAPAWIIPIAWATLVLGIVGWVLLWFAAD
jgi:hypothetical protein